jgi:hypothetical protein
VKIDINKLKMVMGPRVDGVAYAVVEVRCALCGEPTAVRVPEADLNELSLEDLDFCPHNAPTLK